MCRITAAALLWALTQAVIARCLWSFLQDATDAYLESQKSGKPYAMFRSDRNPYVIGTQFHVTERPNGGGAIDIASIDSIVTTESDWQFNAAEMLVYVRKEKWTTINFDSRAARTTLKAAADSYLDLFGKPTPGPVPWGIPCEGLEGSVYTGNGSATDRCNVGIPKSCDVPPVSDRRYVIDETVGSVSVLCAKTSIMNYPPDSHEFRIENGKLQYVHAKTVMRNLTAARRSNSVR